MDIMAKIMYNTIHNSYNQMEKSHLCVENNFIMSADLSVS